MSTTNEMIIAATEVGIEASGKEARPRINIVAYAGGLMTVQIGRAHV